MAVPSNSPRSCLDCKACSATDDQLDRWPCRPASRLRLRPFLDLADPGGQVKLEPLAQPGLRHRDRGRWNRSPAAQGYAAWPYQQFCRQLGELVQVFREIKDAFDPQDQLNPGKVIGRPGSGLQNLETMARAPAPPPADPPSCSSRGMGLPCRPGDNGEFDPGLQQHATAALGVETANVEAETNAARPAGDPGRPAADLTLVETAAACRAAGPAGRSIPHRGCAEAQASRHGRRRPGPQANLVRMLASSRSIRSGARTNSKLHADLYSCKLCRTECPSGVDVSTMLEAGAAHVVATAWSTSSQIFSRIELWAAGEPVVASC